MSRLFTCLIRTHHITSRKKLARVKKAATSLGVAHVLVRSGGSPGIMYGEGPAPEALDDWVAAVQALRYKDFQCLRRAELNDAVVQGAAGFDEVETVREFAERIDARGGGEWWRRAMGYLT